MSIFASLYCIYSHLPRLSIPLKTWISHQLKEIYEFFCFPVDPVEISSWLHIIWNQMVRVNWQKKLRNIHPVGGDLKKVATCNLYTLQAGKQKTEYEARCSGLPKGNQIPLIARVWGTPNWGLDVKVKKPDQSLPVARAWTWRRWRPALASVGQQPTKSTGESSLGHGCTAVHPKIPAKKNKILYIVYITLIILSSVSDNNIHA